MLLAEHEPMFAKQDSVYSNYYVSSSVDTDTFRHQESLSGVSGAQGRFRTLTISGTALKSRKNRFYAQIILKIHKKPQKVDLQHSTVKSSARMLHSHVKLCVFN